MRILIDECVDPRITLLFGDHQVSTVHAQGWDTLEDRALLTLAQSEFDVLVTLDGSLEFQQNISKFAIGVVVVHVPRNQLSHYRFLHQELLQAIDTASAGKVIHVHTPPAPTD
jgi:predicted nuclease of predicted toxin-antitoxin system